MTKQQTIIRMGAAKWDATIPTTDGQKPLHFDLSKMTRDERREFHAAFMAAYRKTTRKAPHGNNQRRRTEQRSG